MKNLIPLLLTILFFLFSTNGYGQKNEVDNSRWAPFSKVLYEDKQPFIEVDGHWVKLITIENLPIEKYIQMAIDEWPTKWQDGFHEKLYRLMRYLDIERNTTVQASYEFKGKTFTKEFIPQEDYRKLAAAFHDSIVGLNRIDRQHSVHVPEHLDYLTQRLDGFTKTENWLTAPQAIHDLEHLEWRIDRHYSYATLTGFDYKLALDAIRNKLGAGISKRDFALQLKLFMANFGDGHSRVSFRDVAKKEDYKWLPFEVIKHEEKYYAIQPTQKTFYNKKFPQVTAINNIAIEKLFEIAKALVPKTSQKFVTRNAVDYLNITAFLLKMAGEKDYQNATVTFSNGKEKINAEFLLEKTRLGSRFENHRLKDSLLQDNIGYIAFNERMYAEDGFIDSLHLAMQKMKNTQGLLIDIRRNPGGRRDPLIALLPYFIKETKVVNIARFRMDSTVDIHPKYGFLNRRFLYPESLDVNSIPDDEDRKAFIGFKEAVAKCKETFKPAVTVSNNKFTEYHFMTITPDRSNQIYYYDKPVIVLIDEGCFSASDIFAAGIRQGDRVTLLGNTTGGGSGFSTGKYLPNSKIRVKLSQMFSYQPNGQLYDGHGVVPDIIVDYDLESLMGLEDLQLSTAIDYIKQDRQ